MTSTPYYNNYKTICSKGLVKRFMSNSFDNSQAICVITAMAVEFNALIDQFKIDRNNVIKLCDEYYIAECAEKNLVIAQAGIGKLRAKECAKILHMRYPYIMIYVSFGLAGSLSEEINVGDIVMGSSILETNDQGEDKSYKTIEHKNKKHVYSGLVFCSNKFINSEKEKNYLHKKFGALCVEMESSGIAQFIENKNIPIMVIKIISDQANEKSLISIFRLQKTLCKSLAKHFELIVDNVISS